MSDHFYEPSQGHRLPHDPFNAIVAPRPIGWISSISAEGRRNLAPYSFFNGFNYTPPIVGFSSIGWKDSAANIAATGEFTWNLVSRALAERMNATSVNAPAEIDEWDYAGLAPAPSKLIGPERVADAPVSFECRLTQQLRLSTAAGEAIDSWLTLGEVVGVHIDDRYLVDGAYQTAMPEPALRAGGATAYFSINPESRFDYRRPVWGETPARAD